MPGHPAAHQMSQSLFQARRYRERAVPGIDDLCTAGPGSDSSTEGAVGLHQLGPEQHTHIPQPENPPDIHGALTVHAHFNHRNPQGPHLIGENRALGNRQDHIVPLPIPGGEQVQKIPSRAAQIGVGQDLQHQGPFPLPAHLPSQLPMGKDQRFLPAQAHTNSRQQEKQQHHPVIIEGIIRNPLE